MIEHDIRWSEMEDLRYLEEWFSDSAACEPFPWTVAEKSESLKNWIGFSRYRASLTGTVDGIPVAIGTLFLMPYKKVAHHCSFYLIVAPQYRRKGIGTSMVRNLIHLAKTKFRLELIHAELYETTQMLPLLQKLKFEQFAFQENYVKINGSSSPRILLEHNIT